jgi:hypothetical protein
MNQPSSSLLSLEKKKHELTGWLGPSQTSFQPATVQRNRLGSGCVLHGPSSTRAEPRKARAEPKARPVRPALTYCHGKNYRKPYFYANCIEIVKTTNLCEMDPKSPKEECESGEAYVKHGHQKFIVTDDLHVLPLSLASTLQVISEAKIQKRDLVEKELALTKPQVIIFVYICMHLSPHIIKLASFCSANSRFY